MKRLIFLAMMISGCTTTQSVVLDPLYFTPGDTVVIHRKQRWIGGIGEPYPIPYYYPMGGWSGVGYSNGYRYEWYRPKDIVVVKPSVSGGRSGEVKSQRRRGRD